MEEFSFPYETCEAVEDYPVLVSTFEEESEQRRLVTSKRIVGFSVKMPNMIEGTLTDIRDFHSLMKGKLTTFLFTYAGDTFEVRFDSPLQTNHVGGVFTASFSLKVIVRIEEE